MRVVYRVEKVQQQRNLHHAVCALLVFVCLLNVWLQLSEPGHRIFGELVSQLFHVLDDVLSHPVQICPEITLHLGCPLDGGVGSFHHEVGVLGSGSVVEVYLRVPADGHYLCVPPYR